MKKNETVKKHKDNEIQEKIYKGDGRTLFSQPLTDRVHKYWKLYLGMGYPQSHISNIKR